jgi:hypothetical protein
MDRHIRIARPDGAILVAALLILLLLSALGAAVTLITSSEPLVASSFQIHHQARYAAEAAAERAMSDLAAVTDWNLVLNGALQSTFMDGSSGPRTWPGGAMIDLKQIVNQANCGKRVPCSSAEMDAATAERPWGPNNPRWQVYAAGLLADLLPNASIDPTYYVVALVGDDASEIDGDPSRDGAPGDPGAGVIALRGEAFGPRRAHKVVELTIGRAGRGGIRVISWRDVQ